MRLQHNLISSIRCSANVIPCIVRPWHELSYTIARPQVCNVAIVSMTNSPSRFTHQWHNSSRRLLWADHIHHNEQLYTTIVNGPYDVHSREKWINMLMKSKHALFYSTDCNFLNSIDMTIIWFKICWSTSFNIWRTINVERCWTVSRGLRRITSLMKNIMPSAQCCYVVTKTGVKEIL